jgi:hypothetical protein
VTNATRRLRHLTLVTMILLLVQASLGMVVNLDVAIPDNHSGAQPSSYFSGSFRSVTWAVGHGAAALAVHAALGLALGLLVIWVAGRSFALGRSSVQAWAVLGGVLVLGAGFNGASFLDYNHDSSSLLMALLAFGALACYTVVLFVLRPESS